MNYNKLIIIIFFLQVHYSIGQTIKYGTIISTPLSLYFVEGKFVKNDSAKLISIIKKDTLIATSFGGIHATRLESLGNFFTVKYPLIQDDTSKLDVIKIYYKCASIEFRSLSKNIISNPKIRNEFLFSKDGFIEVKSRFSEYGAKLKLIDCPIITKKKKR